ncbi:hypothetical protein [Streptomyces sp. NPDC058297]|uniref:hypothetical protein n=1 Tax=Streptomyces sp. NPDC058297 TaxID=3346433 RepID=UPI0036F0E638
MAEQPNPRDLALQFLFQQFARISPPGDDTAGRITIRTSDGTFVGDIRLSDSDVEALGITIESLANCKECTEESTEPKPLEVGTADINSLLTQAEAFANGEQL